MVTFQELMAKMVERGKLSKEGADWMTIELRKAEAIERLKILKKKRVHLEQWEQKAEWDGNVLVLDRLT